MKAIRILLAASVLVVSLAFGFAQASHGSATISPTRNTITPVR
jgi:hypothetical protein